MQKYTVSERCCGFLMIFVALTLILSSSSLPAAMAELDRCNRQCFQQKQQCYEGVEDFMGGVNHCQDDLVACKRTCITPHKGYRPVHGIQLQFKVKPLIQDIRLFKKKEKE